MPLRELQLLQETAVTPWFGKTTIVIPATSLAFSPDGKKVVGGDRRWKNSEYILAEIVLFHRLTSEK